MSLSNILKTVSNGESKLIEPKTLAVRTESFEQIIHMSPEEQASRMIKEAEHESERIRKQIEIERDTTLQNLQKEKEMWVEEREKERKVAQNEGFKEGFTIGNKEAETAWIERLNEARNILAAADIDYKKKIESTDTTILELSIAVAGRIVSEVLEKAPESWMTLVKNAIQEVRDQEIIKIIVSPSRFMSVMASKDDLQTISHDAVIQIFPDESLRENDCFIETPYGRIDTSLDQQLSIIKKTLKEYLEAAGNEDRDAY